MFQTPPCLSSVTGLLLEEINYTSAYKVLKQYDLQQLYNIQ